MKKFKSFIIAVVIVYMFTTGFLYSQQRNMIYHPVETRPDASKIVSFNGEVVQVETEDGIDIEGWFLPNSDKDKPIILFFHGNAGNIEHRLFKVFNFLQNGYGVLLAEYRGYGGNPGDPMEQGFYYDARAYLKWLVESKEVSSDNIIIYGESIGTGVAVQIASENKFKAVVLEAPYSSIVDVAAGVYPIIPVNLLVKDQFRSAEKISSIDAPLLIVHGTKDRVIPIKLSKKLYDEALDPKSFVEIKKAGHNDLYNYGASSKVLEFIDNIR